MPLRCRATCESLRNHPQKKSWFPNQHLQQPWGLLIPPSRSFPFGCGVDLRKVEAGKKNTGISTGFLLDVQRIWNRENNGMFVCVFAKLHWSNKVADDIIFGSSLIIDHIFLDLIKYDSYWFLFFLVNERSQRMLWSLKPRDSKSCWKMRPWENKSVDKHNMFPFKNWMGPNPNGPLSKLRSSY